MDLEGSGYGLIEVPAQHLPGRIQEDMKELPGEPCPSCDLNTEPPKYESTAST
jgi:hypothetical protein